MFKFRSFVKPSSMPIESLQTTIFFLETKSLPSIPTKCYESEPNLPKPTHASSTSRWRATEWRLHFVSPTQTRVNSDSCVNDGYYLRFFSVDTLPSTYFSPFPSRSLPRSARTMTDSSQLRSSISLPGTLPIFLLSRSTSALNTLQAALAL